MTWSLELSQGYEVRKCRHRIVSYLEGAGLDIGCGEEKVCPQAIGVDIAGSAAQIILDLNQFGALKMFNNDYFNYVFSSHCLEDMDDIRSALSEWWRVIRYGGYLILYGPDPDYYPRRGTSGANPNHKHDLYWQDVWKIVKQYGNAKLISASRHNESNEYSWQLIVQKTFSIYKGRCFDCPIKKGFFWRLRENIRNYERYRLNKKHLSKI